MDAAAYRREIATCLRDAAVSGQIEQWYRIGRGSHKVTQDATQMSVAFYLVDVLVDCPFWTHEPRLMLALQPLEPELGRCITELRRLVHVEEFVKRGEVILANLRARVGSELSDPISTL